MSPNVSGAHLPQGSTCLHCLHSNIYLHHTQPLLNNGILTISAWALCWNFIELGINKFYHVTHFILHKWKIVSGVHHWRHLRHLVLASDTINCPILDPIVQFSVKFVSDMVPKHQNLVQHSIIHFGSIGTKFSGLHQTSQPPTPKIWWSQYETLVPISQGPLSIGQPTDQITQLHLTHYKWLRCLP